MIKPPIFALAIAMTSGLASAADFHFRFYKHDDYCNHNAATGDTSPPNDRDPNSGNVGACYSAPTGTDWQRLEIDNDFAWTDRYVQTYCDINCRGGFSIPTTERTAIDVLSVAVPLGAFNH
ncbi:hypothetical protein B0T18DRAFT_431776 [Schizothecium vesticola]|uniref:Uncharacterized protein n=1 Tax=Schizothecium vesticola TaxID=314040 RepID=A0AA40EJF5_9PEZI|nr:hypothetical protein B0T18DRAFT_431776 [Schizothecium vesticola]